MAHRLALIVGSAIAALALSSAPALGESQQDEAMQAYTRAVAAKHLDLSTFRHAFERALPVSGPNQGG